MRKYEASFLLTNMIKENEWSSIFKDEILYIKKWKKEIIECFMIYNIDFMNIICIFIFYVNKIILHFLNYYSWYLNRIEMNEWICLFSSYRDSDANQFPDYRHELHGLWHELHELQMQITWITGTNYMNYIISII